MSESYGVAYADAKKETQAVYKDIMQTLELDDESLIPNRAKYIGDYPENLKAKWEVIKS